MRTIIDKELQQQILQEQEEFRRQCARDSTRRTTLSMVLSALGIALSVASLLMS